MRLRLIILMLFTIHHSPFSIRAQETPVTEQQLENLTDADQNETEDDSYLQLLEQFIKNPLNLNTAEENDLKELKILSGLQIANLLSYRKLLGKFISIYELQAIPSWDIQAIRKILPFVNIAEPIRLTEVFKTRFGAGDNTFLLRLSQAFRPIHRMYMRGLD